MKPRAWYSPEIWLTISRESLKMSITLTWMLLAWCSPTSKASYSASLLEDVKPNLTLWNLCPSGDISMIPAPECCSLDEPSTYNFHEEVSASLDGSVFIGSWMTGSVNSATKFASACPLIIVRGWYCMSN